MDQQELDNIFSFHPANTEQRKEEHETVRMHCRNLSRSLNFLLPEGFEKEMAIKYHLREVMMWANSALALKD